MKRWATISLVLVLSLFSDLQSQTDITGQWNGLIKAAGTELRLVFHISQTGDSLTGTMDSPDEGVKGIPISQVTFENRLLSIGIEKIGGSFNGQLNDNQTIEGTFQQGFRSFPMNLTREEIKKSRPNRPQEPLQPYPYQSNDIIFKSTQESIELAGTITIPEGEGPFPAVVLISGSGPQDRDETFMDHKPFLVLSDYLTRNGIAVLRYDDRGFGESGGNHNDATSQDFAKDVEGAIRFLRERNDINPNQIGLIGHSEGGLIAPIVASKDERLSFIILMAGPGVNGAEIEKQQLNAVGQIMGMSQQVLSQEQKTLDKIYSIVNQNKLGEEMKVALTNFFEGELKNSPGLSEEVKKQFIQNKINNINRAWYKYFINHEPSEFLPSVKSPILAINGSKDVQIVPANLDSISKIVSSSDLLTVKKYEGLNHLFQSCNSCLMTEYAQIELTISPLVLNDIVEWINSVIK